MSPSDHSPVLFRHAPLGAWRSGAKRFAGILQTEVAGGRTFECLITDDGELRRLNREFRGQDYATDVLSFPEGGESGSLGSIAISSQRAAEQAEGFGHAFEREIEILMLHGVLHLLGMDHERDRGRMARTEASWRRKLGLPAGLIERARA